MRLILMCYAQDHLGGSSRSIKPPSDNDRQKARCGDSIAADSITA